MLNSIRYSAAAAQLPKSKFSHRLTAQVLAQVLVPKLLALNQKLLTAALSTAFQFQSHSPGTHAHRSGPQIRPKNILIQSSQLYIVKLGTPRYHPSVREE